MDGWCDLSSQFEFGEHSPTVRGNKFSIAIQCDDHLCSNSQERLLIAHRHETDQNWGRCSSFDRATAAATLSLCR